MVQQQPASSRSFLMKLSLPVGLWLSLLAASNAFSPTSAGFQLDASRTQQQPPFTRTCLLSTTQDASPDDDEEAVSKFSKVKWKKKRFLMKQDVKQSIRQGSPHAPRKAQEMIRRMLTLYEKSGHDIDYKPTCQAYNLWINALARSKLENAGDLAEQVLEDMKADGVEPDIITYTSVMDAHAKSKSPEKAEKVLYQLLEQNADSNDVGVSSVTCDTILNAWAQHGTKEGAERAQSILQKLEMWQQKEIRPTKFSYTTVINAWAKVGTGDAAMQAEALLQQMLRPSPRKDEELVHPDTVVFNAAINAWASSGDPQSGTKALALLRQMKQLEELEGYDTKPDIITYNTILSAWSHCGHINAAPQTEKIVSEMQSLVAESMGAAAPNTVSYNAILHAWSKSTLPGAAPRAQKVLDFMISTDRKGIEPDVYSFTSVMDAWAKSKEPNKGKQARELLDKLSKLFDQTKRPDLKPTQIPYNTVLNACAFSAMDTTMEEQRDALQIAVDTFRGMREAGVDPDTVTYGNLLKCFANLVPQGQGRSDMSLGIFEKCIEDGLVGSLVWNEVRRAVPLQVLAQKFQLKGSPGSMTLRDLPHKWRRRTKIDTKGPKTRNHSLRDNEVSTEAKSPGRVITESSYQSGRDV